MRGDPREAQDTIEHREEDRRRENNERRRSLRDRMWSVGALRVSSWGTESEMSE
jgi:hypothetical protein